MFDKATIIGIGMIGSSIALNLKRSNLVRQLTLCDVDICYIKQAYEMNMGDEYEYDVANAVKDADIVIICTPVRTFADIAAKICPVMKKNSILTDVGSVKSEVIKEIVPHLRKDIYFVPAHPVAGSEKSGPTAADIDVFKGRWNIITPIKDYCDEKAVFTVKKMWEAFGMKITEMTPEHHDRNMAIVSHLPHFLAYNMVYTASEIEKEMDREIIKYSAGGFRDSTRLAGSSPEMWRDIFMSNEEALFEILDSYINNLLYLKGLIKNKDGNKLIELFSKTREIRSKVIAVEQN